MSDFWGTVKGSFVSGVKNISVKTEELTRVGRLKLEIIALKRNLEQMMIELGGVVYHQMDNGDDESLAVSGQMRQLADRIKKLEVKLDGLKEKLELIRKENGIDIE